MKIKFAAPALPAKGVLVVFASEGAHLMSSGTEANKRCNGQLTKAMAAAKFEAKRDSVLDVLAPGGCFDRIFVVGLGAPDTLAEKEMELLGGVIAGALQSAKAKAANVAVELPAKSKMKIEDAAALVASGASLRVYSFDSYKTKKADKAPQLEEITILSNSAAKAIISTRSPTPQTCRACRCLNRTPAH